MSDITKKIFSIDEVSPDTSAADTPPTPPQKTRLELRPLNSDPLEPKLKPLDLSAPPIKSAPPKPVSSDEPEIGLSEAVKPPRPKIMSEPTAAERDEPVMPRFIARETLSEAEPVGHGLTWVGIVLGLLTALSVAAWAYGYFELGRSGTPLTPAAFAALICAVTVPAVTVLFLFLGLRSLQQSRAEGRRLAMIADRLTRADENVAQDVATLSGAIRAELSSVDARLAQSRAAVDAFQDRLSDQAAQMDDQTRNVAERAETIGRAMTLHRQALETLANTVDQQLQAVAETVQSRKAELESSTASAKDTLLAAHATLNDAAQSVDERAISFRETVAAAREEMQLSAQEMEKSSDRVAAQTDALKSAYAAQSENLSGLSDAITGDQSQMAQAMSQQIDCLSAIDAQIERTETKLTQLADRAQAIQNALDAKLTDIEATLTKANTHSQAFTRDMTDRVSDSIAETRRDMSLMETELRALQSRISAVDLPEPELDLSVPDGPSVRRAASTGRIHLKPLETDFPPLDPPGASPPRPSANRQAPLIDPPAIEAPEPIAVTTKTGAARTASAASAIDNTLDLVPFSETGDTASANTAQGDVLRRPGHDGSARSDSLYGQRAAKNKPKGKTKGGWHWRDMLGGIDPLDHEDAPSSAPSQVSTSAVSSNHETSHPQTPVSSHTGPANIGPTNTLPAAPALSEGSEIVARLCEVKLAPSAIVDEGTILDTAHALIHDTERLTDVVLRRLDEPVAHLRGALSADLEFKLRAETFCRTYGDRLLTLTDEGDIRSNLGSANGRAFLLCAAALRD